MKKTISCSWAQSGHDTMLCRENPFTPTSLNLKTFCHDWWWRNSTVSKCPKLLYLLLLQPVERTSDASSEFILSTVDAEDSSKWGESVLLHAFCVDFLPKSVTDANLQLHRLTDGDNNNSDLLFRTSSGQKDKDRMFMGKIKGIVTVGVRKTEEEEDWKAAMSQCGRTQQSSQRQTIP